MAAPVVSFMTAVPQAERKSWSLFFPMAIAFLGDHLYGKLYYINTFIY